MFYHCPYTYTYKEKSFVANCQDYRVYITLTIICVLSLSLYLHIQIIELRCKLSVLLSANWDKSELFVLLIITNRSSLNRSAITICCTNTKVITAAKQSTVDISIDRSERQTEKGGEQPSRTLARVGPSSTKANRGQQ